jgi:phospholipid/cholesterol/gamma-HCH transport system substrate-binding protein
MSWLGSPEFKVGFLVITVSGMIAGMAMKVANGPGMLSGKKDYFFHADSAGGLVPNSAVKMAGIKVGVIEDIVLENGHAKIVVALEKSAKLTSSAHVEVKTDGILGDKHVELIPGKDEDPELPTGSELVAASGKGGMDDIMSDVSRVTKSLNELLETLNKATKTGDDTTSIGRIVGNIEKITADLKDVTGENKDKVREILDRIKSVAQNIDTYVNADSLAKLDHSLKNIDDITTKINKGEGTLGRLINDDQTVEELNTAITSVNNFLGGAEKMELSLDFHSEFMTSDQNKSYLGIKIQPGLDRYYELDVISNTIGVKTQEVDTAVQDGVSSTVSYTKVYKNSFEITGLFAKNFYDFTLKGGIIENYGGVAVDYFPFGDHNLRLSTELYEFQALQWRLFARYNFFRGFYLLAGGDNLLSNDQRPAAAFVGAGLFITNDDLKMLATKFSFR